jgi:ABC-type polysaccharide/polyol phosphate transport system ATPase subunit
LKDVSFEVKGGECLGLIGANGAGKSTLLKMLNGLILPDKGKITVRGRIGALLELGAGFHPMLTGRENIYLSGALLGLSNKETDKKFDEIVAFAELEEFLDMPVKFYSNGMYARLGFAVAVHADPDVLLVDEALAVGDLAFNAKCFDKINSIKSKGTTIILVSSDVNKIAEYSDRVLMLYKGKIFKEGELAEVISSFKRLMNELYVETSRTDFPDYVDRFGTRGAEILEAELLGSSGVPIEVVRTGENCILKLVICFHEQVVDPIVGFILRSPSNLLLHNTHSFMGGRKLGTFEKGQTIEVRFKFINNLLKGVYSLTPAISYPDGINFFDYRPGIISLRVIDNGHAEGIVNLDTTIEITNRTHP